MQFVPEDDGKQVEVPTYDEVQGKSAEGWTGHTTGLNVIKLKGKIVNALSMLGANVSTFQSGHFIDENSGMKRMAMRINYFVSNEAGDAWPGVLDIAALPVDQEKAQTDKSYANKLDKSLRMAMYMTLTALQGAWNMKMLSPGYSPLMPWMIASKDGSTMSEQWEATLNDGKFLKQLPAPQAAESSTQPIDGDFEEVQ